MAQLIKLIVIKSKWFNTSAEVWRAGSEVWSPRGSSSRPEFCSHPSVTSVSGDLISFSDLLGSCTHMGHIQIYRHMLKIKVNNS